MNTSANVAIPTSAMVPTSGRGSLGDDDCNFVDSSICSTSRSIPTSNSREVNPSFDGNLPPSQFSNSPFPPHFDNSEINNAGKGFLNRPRALKNIGTLYRCAMF